MVYFASRTCKFVLIRVLVLRLGCVVFRFFRLNCFEFLSFLFFVLICLRHSLISLNFNNGYGFLQSTAGLGDIVLINNSFLDIAIIDRFPLAGG